MSIRTTLTLDEDVHARLKDESRKRGIPFRQAHNWVGQAVRMASQAGKPLNELSPEELQTISPNFKLDLEHIFNPIQSLERHNVFGGTATHAVQTQIKMAHSALQTKPIHPNP